MFKTNCQKSNSSNSNLALVSKTKEWFSLFKLRFIGLFEEKSFEDIFQKIESYDTYLLTHLNKRLSEVSILEIGYGARPNLLISLNSMGIKSIGIDLDQPILFGYLNEIISIFRENGFERALKSTVRFYLFDWHERSALKKALKAKGYEFCVIKSNFLVGDVSNINSHSQIEERCVDVIISEDVFEHISQESLKHLVSKMAKWINQDGLALIRPFIYTGISGNHLPEWYPHTLEDKDFSRESEPWEHLRKNRFQANTYLNLMSRSDYRDLFLSHFDILEEKVMMPELGRDFWTDTIRHELSIYPEEELFSNSVLFILKPKPIEQY